MLFQNFPKKSVTANLTSKISFSTKMRYTGPKLMRYVSFGSETNGGKKRYRHIVYSQERVHKRPRDLGY